MSTNRFNHLPADIARGLTEHDRRDLERVWRLLGSVPQQDFPDDTVAWTDITRRIDLDVSRRHSGARRVRDERPPIPHSRFAIAIAGGLFLVAAFFMWITPRTVSVSAGPGQMISHELPDGSTVRLNSGSEIAYSRDFKTPPFGERRRSVRFSGEAIFNVVSGDGAFEVLTYNARVVVHGTRFNVRARDESFDGGTYVTLLTGTVTVTGHSGADAILRVPGAATRVVDGVESLSIVSVAPERAAAWADRAFVVEDRPIGSILAEIGRRFALDVVAGAGVELDTRMSMFYPSGADAATILNDLCIARGLTLRRTTHGYRIDIP